MRNNLIEKFLRDNFNMDCIKIKYLTDFFCEVSDKEGNVMHVMQMFTDIIVKIDNDFSCKYYYDVVSQAWIVRPNGQTCI